MSSYLSKKVLGDLHGRGYEGYLVWEDPSCAAARGDSDSGSTTPGNSYTGVGSARASDPVCAMLPWHTYRVYYPMTAIGEPIT